MTTRRTYTLVIVAALILLIGGIAILNADGKVKEPAVAGAFYPADKAALAAMVNAFLSQADSPKQDGELVALIAPHAGYEYSGQVAAYTYRQLAGRKIDTVILIGPSHYASFTGVSVYTDAAMRTPLGDVTINRAMAKSLLDEKADVAFNRAAFAKEHSLEVQLPFLQTVLKDFTLVPVVVGSPTQASFSSLTSKLLAIMRKNPNVIMIASTDLSHYHDYGTAKTMDRKVIDATTRMSPDNLEALLSSGEGEMCGGYPVLFTLAVAQGLGATDGALYRYANSGDVTGDKTRVVGYAAMGLYRAHLTERERRELLDLAKKTIASYVKSGKTLEYSGSDPRFLANGAVFVTINRQGSLRGCIGNIIPVMPLHRSVISNAVAACSRDPRFAPMSREELKDMEVEVTVLSPLVPLDDIKNIVIGRHGLYLTNGMQSGVLLPQVAEEYHWDVPTFLEQVSLKAGMSKDAWKNSQLYTFTADVIK